ncbi:class I SAM-dependent methyltransferase [Parasphingopyxis algicola]|uniref:class I SAM-dependent methyltransferase n=1 Tax=Parasphingopyxis algicola TaxID=2026624 RepID=UPI0015A0F460|nr:class I SAM-dependent methyltransferase [Parasphingopyxis algicola]QLC26413.1 class I SAM-dependent methyltransferase [Parasphingopyxis algicola]
MAFFTADTPASVRPLFGLSQRGRSGLEMLGSIQKFSSTALRDQAKADFDALPEAQELIAVHGSDNDRATVKANVTAARDLAYSVAAFRLERFCQGFVALDIFARALPAIEERRDQFEKYLEDTGETAGGTVELSDNAETPKYYDNNWHLEPDGWDGYDLYGPLFAFALGPLVFRHGGYAAVNVGDDLTKNRFDILKALPKTEYERIYEPGCGGGTTITTIAQAFPDAEVVGSDISPLLLRMAHLVSERRGYKIQFKQRELTDTGEPDESFDAVVTYALHHELPPKENRRLFDEMFRIMKPGADFVLADPPPFREVELFHAVILDWDTKNRSEPFFTVSCLENWDQALREAGFVDVESYAAGPNGFPWVIRGSKPETVDQAKAA